MVGQGVFKASPVSHLYGRECYWNECNILLLVATCLYYDPVAKVAKVPKELFSVFCGE